MFDADDPFLLTQRWLTEAEASEPNDPAAMALATADAQGLPDVRMVLLKEIEGVEQKGGGFVFYTNYESAKGEEIDANPQAAFVIHWKSLRRQIRARGPVEKVSAAQSDAYFKSRPYKSRIGALASAQSRALESREALLARSAALAARHPLDPPRPDHWGGFRIRPIQMEFWRDGAFRLHDRERWRRADPHSDIWERVRLNP